MTWGYVAMAAGTVVAGVVSSDSQRKAANRAAGAQTDSAQAGIDAQQQQFDQVRELLAPYVQGGNKAFAGQQDLAGLNGNDAQGSAIAALRASPQFQSLLKSGETSILANASATGGLRGGNTQAALAQFSPALLSQLITDQYGRLGGIASIGQNAAAGVGNAGMQTGGAISGLLQQQGAAQAGAALAGGNANAGMANTFAGALGMLGSSGALGRLFGGTGGTAGGYTGNEWDGLATKGGGF